ncbi:MAG TPA: hypothetical protein VNT77_09065, partial [Allosphingosinicella sp.]|nr:hypothetical protein [Allosphingosinicella sp.]
MLALLILLQTVYVSNEELNVVHVIDGRTLKESRRIEIGSGPRGMALSPDGRTLYVAVSRDNRIAAVDSASGKVIGHIPS